MSKAILWGGNGADIASTLYALQQPGVKELNPIYGSNPHPAMLVGTKVASGLLSHILLNKLAKEKPDLANLLAKILGGVQGGVGVHNLVVANKH